MKPQVFAMLLSFGMISSTVAAPAVNRDADTEASVNAFSGAGRWTVKRDEAEVNAFSGAGRWTVVSRKCLSRSTGSHTKIRKPKRDEAKVNAFSGAGRWTVKRNEAEVNAFSGAGRWTVKRDEAEVNAFSGAGRWTVKRDQEKREAKVAGEVDI
ncbi:hypothetical protein K469DRAFT_753654 [Zopfia rhizophila CBS 207.26]|uniref:Uncharacterized protein n=1 Tax=Zopfia rhizophila CBS 207.26 TaxID=1314779 RepID=A0A6A6DQ28_9PEZI|nr:hypothetical protein K469DRAFT_753654 [Zopfia rhizophila CBS 207.26]